MPWEIHGSTCSRVYVNEREYMQMNLFLNASYASYNHILLPCDKTHGFLL